MRLTDAHAIAEQAHDVIETEFSNVKHMLGSREPSMRLATAEAVGRWANPAG